MNKKKFRIAMVVYSFYPADTRVRREAEALVDAGMSVDVICLMKKHEAKNEIVRGINTHRIILLRRRGSKLRYLIEYGYFLIRAFLKLSLLHLSNKYDIVHIHNMPDILVFTAFVPKLTGAKIIIDLHDPMPELYMTKFSQSASNLIIRLIKYFEKMSIEFADLVFTPNISFRNLFISRGCPPDKIHIIMNSPMESIFGGSRLHANWVSSSKSDGFVMMYHGTIEERYGLDTAIKACHHLKDEIPITLEVYGNGSFEEHSRKLVADLGLGDVVKFHGTVSLEDIAAAIKRTDVGIIPNKMNPFTNLNFPVRIFEYLAMGKPLIAPPTRGIMDYFDENCLHFFKPGDVHSLASAIRKIYSAPASSHEVTKCGVGVYHRHRWELQRKNLVNLVSHLMHDDSANSAAQIV